MGSSTLGTVDPGHRNLETSSPSQSGFIIELHGVRGIALALVVLFHIFGQGRVSGGVDVFLLFSGYLLTASLFRRSLRREPGRVVRHYARTMTRLVPAAVTVLAGVVVAVVAVRPLGGQGQDLREVIASLLYVENWELISSQLAYGAAGPDASIVQHFWSLSVQGQFFLLWPWAVVGLVALGQRWNGRAWMLAFAGTLAITLFSFACAQVMVAVDQPRAYFHSAARWWELTLGGLVALLAVRWQVPPRGRAGLCWLGLAIIVSSGFVVEGATAFPGLWVLLPLAGGTMVLLGGNSGGGGPARLLSSRPLTAVANLSYELYLWHWPVIIVTLTLQQREVVGPRTAVLILGVSFALAWLTRRFVSWPALRLRRASAGQVITVLIAAVLIAVTAVSAAGQRMEERVSQALDPQAYPLADFPGAEVVRQPALRQNSYRLPAGPPLDVIAQDNDVIGSDCWYTSLDDPVRWCEYGPSDAQVEIAMVGSSRMGPWSVPMAELAERHGWNVKVTTMGGCPLHNEARGSSCRTWNHEVRTQLREMQPDLVIVEGTRVTLGGQNEHILGRQRAAWEELSQEGFALAMIRDVPRFSFNIADCLTLHQDSTDACAMNAHDLYAPTSPFVMLDDRPDSWHEIDLTGLYCPEGVCPAVLGNLITHRDTRHFSGTFARTLSGGLEDALRQEFPGLFVGDSTGLA
ncbi:acyltransferase [Aeromicrobium camelliae]|uniref:Acyltransferase n=1 Tax=Aeromicrobium camelliae TaxID=1538144 RepID=A0A3N6W5T6_9ACTN|nr:acyltransferase family protein [Aeromicrobium camelliae]RQN02899.1 acyltransferase [Aeromicrobium camelliae]